MDMGELKPLPGRPNQVMGFLNHLSLLDPHQAQGAGAVAVAIGGFKVEGDEGR
jgi:hypothetical protein